ncbi:MAG TPA: 3-deoxy-manno-octulosonate cytidylyltransferase [Longimicrobiales bacterium]|nr:3-deoxy-manno-octulosonate cytidylyltransferase [Longimicrobiales bacterium]
MRTGRVLGVIPARLGSERLPRKPLHRLAGRPLIEWVWRRIKSLQIFDELVIATDSDEVAAVVRAFGGMVELTSAAHVSGTDRVAELARRRRDRFDVIVNVQGDEPFLEGAQICAAVDLVRVEWPIGTIATPVQTMSAWQNPAVVKVVRRADGAALYFSRAPLPYTRAGEPDARALGTELYLRHIGVYAYTPAALEAWVALPEHPLERAERLEQLRPLAAGIGIGVAVVASSAEGIDTPEDAARAEQMIESEPLRWTVAET